MSVLERLRGRHLSDRALAHLWTTGGGNPHLDTCDVCRDRFTDFDRWAMELGQDLREEADAAFTAERLAVQHAEIVHRLETLDRPARVIAFPKAARAVISGHSHVRRWVTAGVAAGLIAGVGLGQFVPLRHAMERGPVRVTTAGRFTAETATKRANEIRPVSTSYNDEDFLMDAEALGPRIKDLRALDDLTPRARDLIKRK